MSKQDSQDENKRENDVTDPIILAAMIEDTEEDEEDKKLREDILGTQGTEPAKKPQDDDEEEDDEEEEDQDDDEPSKKSEKKPIEAQDDDEEEDDEEEEDQDDEEIKKKSTRQEKRKQRDDDFFLQSVLKDNAKKARRADIPEYNPIDYGKPKTDEEGNVIEFKQDELDKDREMVGAINFAKGVNEARYWADQDRFWNELSSESKILGYDPDLNFLNEKKPNGEDNPNFDAEKAGEINEMYLQFCGFQQTQKINEQGQPLVDATTGQPIMISTVERTDISYEKFARRYTDRMKKWANEKADEREDEVRSNVIKQKKRQGIRPGNSSRKSLGALQQGDISRMSDEEFERNEDAIDKQIDQMLGV